MSDYLEIVSTSSIESIDNCIICFYPLDKEIAQLSCGHKYHFDCLNSWANKRKHLGNLCCICNKENVEIQTVYNEGDAVLTEADSSDHATGENFTLEVSDHKTFWIQPSISIFDNSALYAKIGRSMADLNVIGAATGAPSNINGTSYAIGTQTISDMGFFIKTEILAWPRSG